MERRPSFRFFSPLIRHNFFITLLTDIQGSCVYARGLEKAGYLSQDELRRIIDGLDRISNEWTTDTFSVLPTDEVRVNKSIHFSMIQWLYNSLPPIDSIRFSALVQ